jgi:NAD(P)-dependent dehydrogenase (short-subunit alcohol dehydrogenase family)
LKKTLRVNYLIFRMSCKGLSPLRAFLVSDTVEKRLKCAGRILSRGALEHDSQEYDMKFKPISQQVVVIIGANSGMGRATAIEFAARGAKVVATGRSADEMHKLAAEIAAQGGEITPMTADTTRFEDLVTVARAAVDTYGGLDTWVHLAGVSVYAPFDQTSPDEFKQVIEVDLIGQAYGAMAALPHLKRLGGGSLIHVSSTEAIQSIPYHSAYAAAKHGIPGFLDSLRMEMEHEGYDVNVVNVMPASINTPFFSKARTRLGVKPAPIPPVYEPDTVVRAIIYAATHSARNLPVGGSAKAFNFLQHVAPVIADVVLRNPSFQLQRTQEQKSDTAPTNLYRHLDGYDQVEGDFSHQARPISLSTWFDIHPALRIAMGLVALTGALMALRVLPARRMQKERMSFKTLPAAYQKASARLKKSVQKQGLTRKQANALRQMLSQKQDIKMSRPEDLAKIAKASDRIRRREMRKAADRLASNQS